MKLVSIISLFVISFLPKLSTNVNENVRINYMGFETYTYSKSAHVLYFCIENNTSKTIYLSANDIKLEVKRGPSIIEEDRHNSGGDPMPPPIGDKRYNKTFCEDNKAVKKRKESLKAQFAQLLFNKNFPKSHFNKTDKEYILQVIANSCIVLLPNSTTSYEHIFNSEKLDESCSVTAKEVKGNDLFFFDTNGKKHNIIY